MGSICSKRAKQNHNTIDEAKRVQKVNKSSVQLVAPTPQKKKFFLVVGNDGVDVNGENKKTIIVERPSKHHHKWVTSDVGVEAWRGGGVKPQVQLSTLLNMPCGPEEELISAGWPSWLTSVAGEAIKGWLPRDADSFQMLDKIGQGTYSSVYKARDLETGKIVAMKKVRFLNMDPESVRFMAREIYIMRKLDHPNVMKLEGLVTSRKSCSLYLVFEYMEHDLAGILATPGIRFTEPQIKCYFQQLLNGLEHCHGRGVLHRDIKGSNLLINNEGVLKIGDFGLANFYKPDQNQPLTSRVVTLWYRAPELLLGATKYGVAIDLWSSGCILAEMFARKPIMPGRTEVEQLHKIFKLCGSPSEDYWQKKKFPLTASFKPHQPYTRALAETFIDIPQSAFSLIDRLLAIEPLDRGSATSALSSEFFTTYPRPCDPSTLPKYPPSKELDAKTRGEEARRRKPESVEGHGPESVGRGSRDLNLMVTPEFIAQVQPKVTTRAKFTPREAGGSYFRVQQPRGAQHTAYSQSTSMIHPSSMRSSWHPTNGNTRKNNVELKTQTSYTPRAAGHSSTAFKKNKGDIFFYKEPGMGYVAKSPRIHRSGSLMRPGGNIEDVFRDHERQIQEVVRKSRLAKCCNDRKSIDLTVKLNRNTTYRD